jgi:hypothetical protein
MIERSFKFFLIIFLTLLIANTNVFAFHKKKGMQKTVYEDLTQKEVQGEYCTNNVEKKFKRKATGRKAKDEDGKYIQIRNKDGIPAWSIKGYHEKKQRTLKELFNISEPKEFFTIAGQKLNFRFSHETNMDTILKTICLEYKETYPRPFQFKNTTLEELSRIIAEKNDLISKPTKPASKKKIGKNLYDRGIIISGDGFGGLVWYLPDYLIDDYKDIKKQEKADADEKERKRQAAIAAEKAKKWVKKNKPILLKKVKAKINEYDKKIKKINVDFDRLDAALKQYLNTFDFAKDGVEETFNITGNKSNKDIKEKLKLLTQKKKSLLNESKITNFELEYEEIFERIGTLKELDNYKNIIKLKKKIDQETKSKNKIKGYEEDFKSLKSKKLGSNKLKDDIVQLNEKITKEENLIKSSVISLKEEIDILDAELSEKDPFDVVIRIAIYVIIFLIVLGLIVYLILQNRKMNQMNLASRSNESKFGKLEDQIKDNAEKMRRAQHTRSRQEKTTLSSVPPQPKEPPKTPEEITFGKYEEMIENYKEALDNFSKVAAFKQKWSGLALTRKERQDGTKTVLINSSRAFEKSEIWCMNFDDRYFALPGSSVKSNMAAYMNLDFEKAQRDFKGVFNITSGSNYFTEVALLRRGGAGFVVEKIGKLQFPQ